MVPAPPVEPYHPPHSIAGFMDKHGNIIATPGGRTIRTSLNLFPDYFFPMKESPVGTDWTFTILASLIIIGVTMTVLILGYLNVHNL